MPGDVAEFLVTVRSSIASDDLGVKLILSGGAELLGVLPVWGSSIEKGVAVSRLITVRFPGRPGGRVRARATLSDGSGGRYSAHDSLGTEPPAKKTAPKGKRSVDSKGRPIIEYRAE
jgi:hypothetical protein